MNALSLLKEHHDEIEELFDKVEAARDGRVKLRLFLELADKLGAHAKMEETTFYPAVKARQTEDMLLEANEEHLQIKRVLADMLELDVDDDTFDAKLKVVKEETDHHNRHEEEGELFPVVKKLLDADELDALGGEMSAVFDELMGNSPRKQIAAETDHAAPI